MGRSVAKQLHTCLKNLDSFTDGQVQMVFCDWETRDLSKITVEISPNDGMYKGNRYKFDIEFQADYPDSAPKIYCLTNIFHPNIHLASHDGSVCVSLLSDWTRNNTIEDIIMCLLFLLHNPNPDDPLSDMFPDDRTESGLQRIQEQIMEGGMDQAMEDYYDISQDTFKEAREAYEGLQQCEWDVLREAAKVAWRYNLEEDEYWVNEVDLWEKDEKERRRKENLLKFDQTVEDRKAAAQKASEQRENQAAGKPSLQRCKTITAPHKLAAALNFSPPDRSTLLAWSQCGEEDIMDCTPPPVPQSHDQSPSCLSVQPSCKSDVLDKPVLQRMFTH